jgi:hypothetical protein
MCYNGAKSWQLGWYTNATATVNFNEESFEAIRYTLVGINDYVTMGSFNISDEKVVLRVRSNQTRDIYLMFNVREGMTVDSGYDNGSALKNYTCENELAVVGQAEGLFQQSWLLDCLKSPDNEISTAESEWVEPNSNLTIRVESIGENPIARRLDALKTMVVCVYDSNKVSAEDPCCPVGYQRNGSVCVDIDECTSDGDVALPCGPDALCENTVGSFRCIDCDSGKIADASGINCVDDPEDQDA